MSEIIETKVFVTNFLALKEGYRLIGNKGGTSSGKTFGFLAALAAFLYWTQDRRRATIIGQTSDELRDGAYKDWETIMELMPVGILKSKNQRIWHVGKSTVIFKSLDKPGKAKSGKDDIVFINEANEISWAIVLHRLLRCRVFCFDWNPSSKFWFQSKIQPKIETYHPYLLTKTTYKDNPACPPEIIREIEGLTGSDYDIYALGTEARRESLIYKYDLVNAIPDRAIRKAGFLDFGYTNDVTAFGIAAMDGDDIYADEVFYKTGLLTKDINDYLIKNKIPKSMPIYCDNIPKDVAELKAYGWNLIKTKKWNGSVRFGINVLRQYRIHVTAKSVNMIEELDNYEWMKKNGEVITPEVPIDKYNHLLDGFRYYGMANASAKVLAKAGNKRVYSDNLS